MMNLNELKTLIRKILKEISDKEISITDRITKLQELQQQTKSYIDFLKSFDILDKEEDKKLNSKISEVQDEIQDLFTMLQDVIEEEKEKEKKQKEEEKKKEKGEEKAYAGRRKETPVGYEKDQDAVKTMPRKKVK